MQLTNQIAMSTSSTTRFSNRVEDYVKYRPHYPEVIVSLLQEQYHVSIHKKIADIGAGTGISAELFLKVGYEVIAVEPNKEMREKSVALLNKYEKFSAVDGTAENSSLPTKSIDVIIAGQAFHWFNVTETKKEFDRILKPNGIVVLIWNERLAISEFEKEYDELIIKHSTDYKKIDHRNINAEKIEQFFHPQPIQLKVFTNKQVFDFKGLQGRLLSSSYLPVATDIGFENLIKGLRRLFDQYKKDNTITINYETKVYVGKL